ncbi:hypothetical protein [Rhodococcus ruber]|uniref:hypothetical protein n=1 Tax=Rhodococcus ruber TaxID=1830 RepID=UPI0003491BC6|nr:hypothetical protein [Rhodococcus ruber]
MFDLDVAVELTDMVVARMLRTERETWQKNTTGAGASACWVSPTSVTRGIAR